MKRFKLPSPAMVVACTALAVALSGASYAAIVLPKNSVGTKQLRNNAVKSAKVAPDTLTGLHINEATLGQVPSANLANSANTANSAATAGNAGLLDNIDSTGFLQTSAAAGGDLSGPFSNLQIGGSTVGTNEIGTNGVGASEVNLVLGSTSSSTLAGNAEHNANYATSSVAANCAAGQEIIGVSIDASFPDQDEVWIQESRRVSSTSWSVRWGHDVADSVTMSVTPLCLA